MKNSIRTVIETRVGTQGTEVELCHLSGGMEIAGAGMRFTPEVWAVEFEIGGDHHSRRFSTEAVARENFDRWTS